MQTQYTYSPFGSTTTQGSSSSNSYQFTGRENDGDGLYYYRARYYDPTLSRFISQDPAGFLAGDNFYRYVLDDPAQATDPSGLWDGIDDVIASGAGAVLGVTSQAISDALAGRVCSAGKYVGAAVGGAVGGETLPYSGNPYLAGAAGGAAGSLVGQEVDNLLHRRGVASVNPEELARDTAFGAALGFFPEGEATAGGIAGEAERGVPAAFLGGWLSGAYRKLFGIQCAPALP